MEAITCEGTIQNKQRQYQSIYIETTNLVYRLIRPGIEPKIHRNRGEHGIYNNNLAVFVYLMAWRYTGIR
jgi:hypothetical protein